MSTQASNHPRFRGVIPPLLTPLSGRDTLDEAGLERLVEHVLAGGVHGIFILGTTGEAPSLSYRLRSELIGRVCELVNQRVPILVGITDTAFVESVHLAEVAADAGGSAVVLSTPYYFPAGQTELTGYVERISRELPLPLMLYNIPVLTKVGFEWETLERLTAVENIIGIKDSGGDFEYFQQLPKLREQRPDWSIMIGPEHLLADAVRAGGDGGVAGGSNIFPHLFVQCFEAVIAGDDPRANLLNEHIQELQRIYSIGKYMSRFIKATKSAVSLLGICEDVMAEPFDHFKAPEREKVREIIEPLRTQLEAVLNPK
ncbi:MAG: dihydrodipicolinate synthase family protein [Planctomycetaceae bacterium]|nr:dihydrodipicolinate synthase family protein [Planctomycetaceae bacterium]